MLYDLIVVCLLVWLIGVIVSWFPSPGGWSGRNPLFAIIAILLILWLLRGPLGLGWHRGRLFGQALDSAPGSVPCVVVVERVS